MALDERSHRTPTPYRQFAPHLPNEHHCLLSFRESGVRRTRFFHEQLVCGLGLRRRGRDIHLERARDQRRHAIEQPTSRRITYTAIRVCGTIGILFSFAPRLATVFGELGSILAERSGTGGCQLKLSLGRGHRCVAHGLERGAIKFCHGFVVLLWAQRRAAADGSLASPRTCPRRQTGARRRPSRCEAARASTNKQFPVKKTVDIDYGIWYKAGGSLAAKWLVPFAVFEPSLSPPVLVFRPERSVDYHEPCQVCGNPS